MTNNPAEPDLANLPFMDSSRDLEARVEDLLSRLTQEEKFKLLSGNTAWSTFPIPRLGMKSFYMTDGPHGIGPHSSNDSVCTYFPVGICRAATWNRELSREFGRALGQEVRDIGYHMILGPGINIIRTPMCGRNFEYQTEDPYLNAEMVVPMVEGIQEQCVAACVKHYIANNQETWRLWVNAQVSRRALEEIYFPGFKAATTRAGAWSYMGCYNRVNGKFGCEHETLLRDTLMANWGFQGFVVSDWGATNFIDDPAGCIRAGLSLEMPETNRYAPDWLGRLLAEGKFTLADLDEDVRRLLRVMFLTGFFDSPKTLPPGSRNTSEHQAIARKVAEEGIVLLKNEGDLLPLDIQKVSKIAIIGPNMHERLSEGGGSSQVKPPYEVSPFEGLAEKCTGHAEITESPKTADVAIIIAGLSHAGGKDGEGGDRTDFTLPPEQEALIQRTVKENPKTIVVLVSGSPVGMDAWLEKVPAVVQAWYAGMEGGRALADILFGSVNPSGKLPVSFPRALEDLRAHASERTYPGWDDEDEGPQVVYEEGIYVGYRDLDAQGKDPLFPFGHGLSYTTFEYETISASAPEITGDDPLTVTVTISNRGARAGAEVVQLYLHDEEASVDRPPKELKGFEKVFLQPGEAKEVAFQITKEHLAFFHPEKDAWVVEDGTFKVLVGSSSRDIRLELQFQSEH